MSWAKEQRKPWLLHGKKAWLPESAGLDKFFFRASGFWRTDCSRSRNGWHTLLAPWLETCGSLCNGTYSQPWSNHQSCINGGFSLWWFASCWYWQLYFFCISKGRSFISLFLLSMNSLYCFTNFILFALQRPWVKIILHKSPMEWMVLKIAYLWCGQWELYVSCELKIDFLTEPPGNRHHKPYSVCCMCEQ